MKINPKTKNHKIYLVIIGVLAMFNIVSVYFLRGESMACGNYSFVNPLIACGHKSVINKKGYEEFKFKLRGFIEEREEKGQVDMAAVWFRDLEFGPTFGINDREEFIPASLLKLPLVLTYYQLAEDDPGLLQKELVLNDDLTPTPNQTFIPEDSLEKNKPYTIDEFIGHAIVDSDNKAAQLLYEYLEKFYPGELSRTYRDIGILEPGHDLNMAAVNTKGYGSIFRLLYNASFLNKEMSEKLLGLLAQTRFEDGLRTGVPEDIIIAHKFGERTLDGGKKQLHDCGIVYYPKNPYQLCIMTVGDNFADLEKIIGGISSLVYEEFDSRRF